MVQKTDDFGHVPRDQKSIQNVYAYYTFHGVAAAGGGREAAATPSKSCHVYTFCIAFWSPGTWPKTSVFCTLCVSPGFPRFQGPYQAWKLTKPGGRTFEKGLLHKGLDR